MMGSALLVGAFALGSDFHLIVYDIAGCWVSALVGALSLLGSPVTLRTCNIIRVGMLRRCKLFSSPACKLL